MDKARVVEALVGAPRMLVGMVHVQALPGTPRASVPVQEVVDRAVEDARAYRDAGFNAVMIENMHDVPYLRRRVGPEVTACMAVVAREVRRSVSLPLGVQVLAGANQEALAVALAAGAQFVRAEGFVFAHVADEGIMESDAGELLRYRRALGAQGVRVFADIKKKHSAHAITADVTLAETAHAAEFFLVDGVIVTGAATGVAADPGEVAGVAGAVAVPTLVGSGITPGNMAQFAAADGFIVGSWVKQDGHWAKPLDAARARAVVEAFRGLP
jgi:hypothetical protein